MTRWHDAKQRVRALPPGQRDLLLTATFLALSFTPGVADKGTYLGWDEPRRAFGTVAALLVLGQCLPLLVRSRAPGPCLLLVSAFFLAYQTMEFRPSIATLTLFVALYNAGLRQVRLRRTTVLALAAGYSALAAHLIAAGTTPFGPAVYLNFFPLPAVSWLLGAWARTRLSDQLREQRHHAESAMREERERIARELHDVVTHHVTAMVMQADALNYVAFSDRAKVEAGLSAIDSTGRRALADLRRLLGVLSPDHDADAAPRAPAAGQFADLVRHTRLAGQPVEFTDDGVPLVLDSVAELAAIRVVQEALTNALKHAPGRRTMVRLSSVATDRVAVDVTTEGTGEAPAQHGPRPEASGRGLAGLHRRVFLAGGELTTQRTPDGGFVVRAVLPIKPDAR
ncbi:sensor histidine kinase [Actinoplanes sp. NPDC049265]|uniref:sensor histidine kinase n=1 Tax=Actinoplanes sp. NPDC049265 TaxID=3363902 RepID=UPI003715114C